MDGEEGLDGDLLKEPFDDALFAPFTDEQANSPPTHRNGGQRAEEEREVRALLKEDKVLAAAAVDEEVGEQGKGGGEFAQQSAWVVAQEISGVAFGLFLSRASWVVIKVTDSALLGHVSTEVLSAASLADIWMACTGVIQLPTGVLGTFVGNALGSGNPRMAGVWLQVSTAVVMALAVPVMLLWFVTAPVFLYFGIAPALASKAGFFACVLALCLPAKTAFGQLSQFFAAQSLVTATAWVSAGGCLLNLVLGLVAVLGVGVAGWSGWGFPACPFVTVAAEYAMAVALWTYTWRVKRLHLRQVLGGWDMKQITRSRIREYLHLYVPAAASGASDWWRVAAVGVFAASLGPLQVAVFNTGYRITWMTLTFVASVGGAMSARLGVQIGAGDIVGGKQTVAVGGGMCAALLLLCTATVFLSVSRIASVFSDDPQVIEAFVGVRLPMCVMLFLMNLSVLLEKVLLAMGRAKTVFYFGVVGSWLGQVPGVFLAMRFWRQDLAGLYWGVSGGYGLLCALLLLHIHRIRWLDLVAEAITRSHVK